MYYPIIHIFYFSCKSYIKSTIRILVLFLNNNEFWVKMLFSSVSYAKVLLCMYHVTTD